MYDMGHKVIISSDQRFSSTQPVSIIKYLFLAVVSIVLLSACAGIPEVEQIKVEKKTVTKPVAKITLEKPVVLLLSSASRVYTDVADEIKKQSSRSFKSVQLTGKRQADSKLIKKIQSQKIDQVVAIGLAAAQAASKLKGKQVIFSQVANPQDYGLVSSWMKGVDVLPSSQKLFQDWKRLDPQLSKVAIITGKNMLSYIKHARQAAERQNIELIHHEVSNDKEFLYASKHLNKDIQGHWIIPDNRILSVNILKEVLSFNAREGKHTVVFSPSLLSFGGLFYVQATEQEISRQINKRLQQSVGKQVIPGQDVLLLSSHQMGINSTVAKRLGIVIPPSYQKHIHD